MFNLPNILTLIRIFVIPFVFISYYLPFSGAHGVAAVIFVIACLTDWLDGYLARALHLSTRLGAFLDPVADKIMVSVALVLLVGESHTLAIPFRGSGYYLPALAITLPASIIISREIIVSALREWMAEIGKRTSVAVSRLGKIKTTIQMIALTLLIYCRPETSMRTVLAGYILLYAAALLTLWSMLQYLRAAWKVIRASNMQY